MHTYAKLATKQERSQIMSQIMFWLENLTRGELESLRKAIEAKQICVK